MWILRNTTSNQEMKPKCPKRYNRNSGGFLESVSSREPHRAHLNSNRSCCRTIAFFFCTIWIHSCVRSSSLCGSLPRPARKHETRFTSRTTLIVADRVVRNEGESVVPTETFRATESANDANRAVFVLRPHADHAFRLRAA